MTQAHANGHVVVALVRQRLSHDMIVGRTWWLYDVVRERARRVRRLPSGPCAPDTLAVWWHRLAYGTACDKFPQGMIFLRGFGRRHRLRPHLPAVELLLRGSLLTALMEEGDGDTAVWRLVVRRKVCPARIPDSSLAEEWRNTGVALSGHNIVWGVRDVFNESAPDVLLGAQLNGCREPGPTGAYALDASPTRAVGNDAVDGHRLYYVAAGALHREPLPDAPVTSPPSNDAFDGATAVAGDAAISLENQAIGRATVQPGERVGGGVTRTVWYAYQPTTTHRVAVSASFYNPLGVFEGDRVDALTRVPVTPYNNDTAYAFDAAAGHTYRISVGCLSAFQCYLPYTLRIIPAP